MAALYKILVTRKVDSDFETPLRSKGILLEEVVCIRTLIKPLEDTILKEISEKSLAGWIFTSQQSVRAIQRILPRIDYVPLVYAVGKKTGQMLEELGLKPKIPSGGNAQSLAELICKEVSRGRFIFFKGNKALPLLPDLLREAGHEIRELEVYYTHLTRPLVFTDNFDAFVFFSPSAVESFFTYNDVSENKPLFAIGTTTARALRNNSSNPIVVAPSPSSEGVQKSLIDYFNR